MEKTPKTSNSIWVNSSNAFDIRTKQLSSYTHNDLHNFTRIETSGFKKKNCVGLSHASLLQSSIVYLIITFPKSPPGFS